MESLLLRYQRTRARTRTLFGLLTDEAYHSRPIAQRNPIVFYDGHLPGFAVNTLVKSALGEPGIDASLERLFARGIDPDHDERIHDPGVWPDRDATTSFVREADGRVEAALRRLGGETAGDVPPDAPPGAREAVFAILEHEAMHQETLLYMWHRLPFEQKRPPRGYQPPSDAPPPEADALVEIPGGVATLGSTRAEVPFGWDNEFPAMRVEVSPFRLERFNVTNGRYLEFVEAGGYNDPRWWTADDWVWLRTDRISHPAFWQADGRGWRWRTLFQAIPLPLSWPVYVSGAEAAAFARWRGGRLLTEAEFQRAAYGSPEGERRYPWAGDDLSPDRAVCDFTQWDPSPVGSRPRGASAWGVEDLVGNGWEWTATAFAPFPGFRPMASYPEYSADFFDGRHVVVKGASPATSRELVRPGFRNWFRPRYPFIYAGFRCAVPA
jgi:ergothioneine biosynthesis protein EgtB